MKRILSLSYRPASDALALAHRWPRRWAWLAVCLLALAVLMPVKARAEGFSEYQVKAVFLFNLVNFVQWPAHAFGPEAPAFTIGVLGHDPFGEKLELAVANETAQGRPIRIVRYTDPAELDRQPCHILFFGPGTDRYWPDLAQNLACGAVLTVSDQQAFVRQGGIINLLTVGRRIQLEINPHNARRAGLKISSKLLSLARLVTAAQ